MRTRASAVITGALLVPLAVATLLPATLLASPTTPAAAARRPHSVDLQVVQTPSGPVLANGRDMTLYVYVDDMLTTAPSACTGDCAADWPPAVVSGRVVVGKGVHGHVGTVVRDDGTRQLTMDGRPLYTFSGDRARGDLRGNGLGNIWWAMTPTGLSATAYRTATPIYGADAPTTLTVVNTRYGRVVADHRGQVLYTYADDTATASACNANWCLVDWPPLQATGTPTAAPSISAPVGTIHGAGGTTQVTLAGHPLYTFAGDLHPGDTRGEGIGEDWWLIAPNGQSVTRARATSDRSSW